MIKLHKRKVLRFSLRGFHPNVGKAFAVFALKVQHATAPSIHTIL